MRRSPIGPLIVGGMLVAITAFLVCTYSYTPHKIKYVLSAPPGMIITVLGFCGHPEDTVPVCGPGASSKIVALFFGSFFLFYFMIGAIVSAAIIALTSKSKRMEQ